MKKFKVIIFNIILFINFMFLKININSFSKTKMVAASLAVAIPVAIFYKQSKLEVKKSKLRETGFDNFRKIYEIFNEKNEQKLITIFDNNGIEGFNNNKKYLFLNYWNIFKVIYNLNTYNGFKDFFGDAFKVAEIAENRDFIKIIYGASEKQIFARLDKQITGLTTNDQKIAAICKYLGINKNDIKVFEKKSIDTKFENSKDDIINSGANKIKFNILKDFEVQTIESSLKKENKNILIAASQFNSLEAKKKNKIAAVKDYITDSTQGPIAVLVDPLIAIVRKYFIQKELIHDSFEKILIDKLNVVKKQDGLFLYNNNEIVYQNGFFMPEKMTEEAKKTVFFAQNSVDFNQNSLDALGISVSKVVTIDKKIPLTHFLVAAPKFDKIPAENSNDDIIAKNIVKGQITSVLKKILLDNLLCNEGDNQKIEIYIPFVGTGAFNNNKDSFKDLIGDVITEFNSYSLNKEVIINFCSNNSANDEVIINGIEEKIKQNKENNN